MNSKNHSNWLHILFYCGLALLTCHELDAVARHEWRLLPGLSYLSDNTGYMVFVLLHIPIFTFIFWATGHQSKAIRHRSQLGIDAFLFIHGILHFLLSGHELYEFEAPVETITVYGAGIVGIIHGLLLMREQKNI